MRSVLYKIAESLEGDMLQTVGFGEVERYGIMSICGSIPDNEVKKNEELYRKLKALEMSMARRFPYYHIAPFGLFLATKVAEFAPCGAVTVEGDGDGSAGSEPLPGDSLQKRNGESEP